MKLRITAFLSLFLFVLQLHAAYLENIPRVLVQPNGDTLRCFATGDEFHHWLHDAKGFTIVQNANTGYFVYADTADGQLVPSSYIAGKVNPASVGLSAYLNISGEEWNEKMKSMKSTFTKKDSPSGSNKNRGIINNLVIFIRFADDTEFSSSFHAIDSMLNDSSPEGNSMYNYFKSASYNLLDVHSSLYPAPNGDAILSYQDMYPRKYYQIYSDANPDGYKSNEKAKREQELLIRAIEYVKPSIPLGLNIDYNDDGQVDNICFIVKGNTADWNNILWPHRWEFFINTPIMIGEKKAFDYNLQIEDPNFFNSSVMSHEFFHTLGAPDLYHYDVAFASLNTVGKWELMDKNTKTPQHSGAYIKHFYGNWIDSIPEITSHGTYTLYPINSPTPHKVAYKIKSNRPNEFFVLEYRKQSKPFETDIPGSGLLIYRINSSQKGNANYNGTTKLDEVYLYRPNGTLDKPGQIENAAFSANSGQMFFHKNSNPTPFFSDGSIFDVSISRVTDVGDSIQFTYSDETFLLSAEDSPITLNNELKSSKNITINSNVPWTISNPPAWFSLSKKSGENNDVISITVKAKNIYFSRRFHELIITGGGMQKTFTVYQDSLPPLGISPDTLTFSPFTNDTNSFSITSNCNWSIAGNESWIELSKKEGSGNATINVISKQNNETPKKRSCLLTISSDGIESKKVLIIQTSTTAIENCEEVEQAVILYPNPAKGSLYVKLNKKPQKTVSATFLNLLGQEALTIELNPNKDFAQIDVSSLKSGIYFLQLFIDGKQITKKVIIE